MIPPDTAVKLLLLEDLSPHKVGLLLLVQVAVNSHVSDEGLIPIVATLVQYLENDLGKGDPKDEEIVVIPSSMDLLSALDEPMARSTGADLTQEEKRIRRLLLDSMWKITSLEKLDVAITEVHALLESDSNAVVSDTFKITKRSLIGEFIHKIYSSFKVLKFDEVFLLYDAFISYRDHTKHLVDTKRPLTRNSDHDTVLFAKLKAQLDDNFGNEATPQCILPVPKHDLEILLNNQIRLLESYGTPTPLLLKKVMKLMTTPDSNISSIKNSNFNKLPQYHYICYLEHLHELNYNGAFTSLHQYFDYVVASNSKHFYHFALISLASLHEYFGENEKAMDSIEEAISVARENKDNDALTYILTWIFNFMRNKPELWKRQSFYNNNNESQLLDIMIKKSQLVSLLLYSLSYNFHVLKTIENGGPASVYLESLLKATYVSINDNENTFIKAAEMNATIWCRIGNPYLSEIYQDVALQSTEKKNDLISLKARNCFLKFYKGETEAAYKSLDQVKHQVLHSDASLFNMVQIRSIIMSTKLCLIKGRFKMAKEQIGILLSNDIKEIDVKNELLMLEIEIEIALENYSFALQKINHLLCDTPNNLFSIQLNLMKCKIYNISGNHAKGLTLLLQQLAKGKISGFLSIIAEGFIILISMLNNLDHHDDAFELLQQAMPIVYSNANLDLVSRAHYELAKNYFSKYKVSNDSRSISKILKFLNLSILGFKKSINLVELTKCFELELEVATLKDEADLISHAQNSIEKLKIRSKEETIYGYIMGSS